MLRGGYMFQTLGYRSFSIIFARQYAEKSNPPQLSTIIDIQQSMHNAHTNSNTKNVIPLIRRMTYQKWNMSEEEKKNADIKLNSPQSLPQLHLLKSKKEVLKEIGQQRPDLKTETSQRWVYYYRMMRNYLNFINKGISNVWKTYIQLKKTNYQWLKPYYVFDNGLDRTDKATGSPKDKKLLLRSNTLDQIVGELATAVRCQENVEHNKVWGFKQKDDLEYIAISRADLQKMLRNKYDIPRLPFFATLFLIFEELSLGIFYISPYTVPTTCVFPRFMPRYFSRCLQAQRRLKDIRKNIQLETIASRNPYDMDMNELRQLCELLLVSSSFKWANYIENNKFMRSRLLQRYKEITLDNYLIVRDGGVDNLNDIEVFASCIRRGLIDFEILCQNIKRNKGGYYTDFVDISEQREILRKFIIDFDDRRNNVGLLGLYITTNKQ